MTKLATSNPGSMLSTVTLPPTYLKLLTSIDDSIAESSSKKKKINATHNRALNGMKQKVKKLQREHESSIQKYQTVSIPEPFWSFDLLTNPVHVFIRTPMAMCASLKDLPNLRLLRKSPRRLP